jgi:hypothetical protein
MGEGFRRWTKRLLRLAAGQICVSWQIVPTLLTKLLQQKDPENSKRVMQAMLQIDKIDISKLQHAHKAR